MNFIPTLGHRHDVPPPVLPPASTQSDFNVEVVQVRNVRPHPNADRLDTCEANGTPVVIRKGDFAEGDLAVFVPLDALVPLANPAFNFLASKSHPERTQARIRAARLRGVYSEGLLVPCASMFWTVGQNVQAELGIEKWLSPADRVETNGLLAQPNSKRSKIAKFNKLCPVYGLDSIIRFPDEIPIGTPVVLTEKIHGSNARYSYQNERFWIGSHRTLRRVSGHRFVEWCKGMWHAVAAFFGAEPNTGFYAELGDIWVRIAEQYDLEAKLRARPGLVVYGEIYGKGLQRRGGIDFVYDAPDGLKFRVFDILDSATGCFLPHKQMALRCEAMGLPSVPVIGYGNWEGNFAEEVYTLGVSLIGGHMREGFVVRTDVKEPDPNRKALKFVGQPYKLLGD